MTKSDLGTVYSPAREIVGVRGLGSFDVRWINWVRGGFGGAL
jgi:hypothetical protein